MDVFSVLLFSLLASFVFDLKIDFRLQPDYFKVLKLLALIASTFIFYFTVDILKQINLDARDEFAGEHDIKKRALKSIDDIYSSKYKVQQIKINSLLISAILIFAMYFLTDAFHNLLLSSH